MARLLKTRSRRGFNPTQRKKTEGTWKSSTSFGPTEGLQLFVSMAGKLVLCRDLQSRISDLQELSGGIFWHSAFHSREEMNSVL